MEAHFVEQWRMEQEGGGADFLQCLIRQTGYGRQFLTCFFIFVQSPLQQGKGYFQRREELAGAVVQVTSHSTPFLVLHPEKAAGKDLQGHSAFLDKRFKLRVRL